MAMGRLKGAKLAGVLILVAIIVFYVVSDLHIGAPAFPIKSCPPGYELNTEWYGVGSPQLQPGYGGAKAGTYPGEAQAVHYLGWTELGGCGQSLRVTTGSSP